MEVDCLQDIQNPVQKYSPASNDFLRREKEYLAASVRFSHPNESNVQAIIPSKLFPELSPKYVQAPRT